MSRRMFVPFHGDGIISQFEGYEELEELDWEAYRARYGDIQRLDRILRAEGDDPDRYKISKQADAVMLFYLFSPSALRRLFERLGYVYEADTARTQHRLLRRRTSHGSTLSFVTHAGALAALDPEHSWERFLAALRERSRRHPGRHDPGGHPHGRHVRDARPYAAGLPRHRDPRRRPSIRAAAARGSRRGVLLMQFQRTPLRVSLDR